MRNLIWRLNLVKGSAYSFSTIHRPINESWPKDSGNNLRIIHFDRIKKWSTLTHNYVSLCVHKFKYTHKRTLIHKCTYTHTNKNDTDTKSHTS